MTFYKIVSIEVAHINFHVKETLFYLLILRKVKGDIPKIFDLDPFTVWWYGFAP